MRAHLALVAATLVLCGFSALAVAQPPPSTSSPAPAADLQRERLDAAETDPRAFLEMAFQHCQLHVHDYTCLYVTQQVLQGKLGQEQRVDVKFRATPCSAFMKWLQNPLLADRLLYVKGRYDDMLLVKPSGIAGLFVGGHVKRALDSSDAAKVSRRRVDEFGFAQILEWICAVNAQAERAGELKLRFAGPGRISGRPTYTFVRVLPGKPAYPDQRLLLHVDQEWLVPLGLWCFGADDQLLARYEFQNVRLNVGLGAADFTPEANGL